MTIHTQRKVLIIGAGYLGERLARQCLEAGMRIWLSSRSAGRVQALHEQGLDCLQLALPGALPELPADLAAGVDCLYFLVPPGALAGEFGAAAALGALTPILEAVQPQRVIMSSSTVVYGNRDGGWVDINSTASGSGQRAQRQLAIEQWWVRAASALTIVRLAGLYGPGRVIGERGLRAGEPVPGIPESWLNLIQIEDAARLLLQLAVMDSPPALVLGVDNKPVLRGDYYGFLAQRLGVSAEFTGKASGRDSRRCSNAATLSEVDWQPEFPTYREGVVDALERGRA